MSVQARGFLQPFGIFHVDFLYDTYYESLHVEPSNAFLIKYFFFKIYKNSTYFISWPYVAFPYFYVSIQIFLFPFFF